jgi:DNA repair protein RecN (Recombination protein N)
MAGNHWIVAKGGEEVITTNIIQLSDAQQRQEEIARMLSGAEVTAEARAAAGKLLEASAA